MTKLLFGRAEIEGIQRKITNHRWAARAFNRIRLDLEIDRDEFLAGTRSFEAAGERATVFLKLALCSRLVDEWHREAAESMLQRVKDLPSFTGALIDPHSGANYGLNGLMISKAAQSLCLGLDFLDGLDNRLLTRIAERVLIPVAERLDKNIRRGGSNWQAMENLALLCIGLVTEHPEYVQIVTSDPERSFHYHLAHSVHPDGFWYEQSLAYHMVTTDHLLKTRWIAGRNNVDLAGDEVLQSMIHTIIRMALPGGSLPILADDRPASLSGLARFLEVAYAMYELPWVGWVLRQTSREEMWSLLAGKEIDKAEEPVPHSELFDMSGICVLKNGTAPDYWKGKGSGATITFGPHGDWHGHPGKLGVEYRHNADYLVRDHGIGSGYALPIHRQWFATTLAHSTVVVDGQNQAFTRTHDRPENELNERGACHAHLFRDDVGACTVSADFAYPGCHLLRTLFMTSSYVVDIMECAGLDKSEHVFDWVFHTGGLIRTEQPFIPRSIGFLKNGYDFIRRPEAFQTEAQWGLDVMECTWIDSEAEAGGKVMRISMLGSEGTTVFKALCPAMERDVYDPVIIVRRQTRQTAFIAIYAPGDQALDLDCIKNDGGTIICRVNREGAGSDVLVKQDTEESIDIDGTTINNRLDFLPAIRA